MADGWEVTDPARTSTGHQVEGVKPSDVPTVERARGGGGERVPTEDRAKGGKPSEVARDRIPTDNYARRGGGAGEDSRDDPHRIPTEDVSRRGGAGEAPVDVLEGVGVAAVGTLETRGRRGRAGDQITEKNLSKGLSGHSSSENRARKAKLFAGVAATAVPVDVPDSLQRQRETASGDSGSTVCGGPAVSSPLRDSSDSLHRQRQTASGDSFQRQRETASGDSGSAVCGRPSVSGPPSPQRPLPKGVGPPTLRPAPYTLNTKTRTLNPLP